MIMIMVGVMVMIMVIRCNGNDGWPAALVYCDELLSNLI